MDLSKLYAIAKDPDELIATLVERCRELRLQKTQHPHGDIEIVECAHAIKVLVQLFCPADAEKRIGSLERISRCYKWLGQDDLALAYAKESHELCKANDVPLEVRINSVLSLALAYERSGERQMATEVLQQQMDLMSPVPQMPEFGEEVDDTIGRAREWALSHAGAVHDQYDELERWLTRNVNAERKVVRAGTQRDSVLQFPARRTVSVEGRITKLPKEVMRVENPTMTFDLEYEYSIKDETKRSRVRFWIRRKDDDRLSLKNIRESVKKEFYVGGTILVTSQSVSPYKHYVSLPAQIGNGFFIESFQP